MISQRHYILNLLFKFEMTENKHVATPFNWNLKLDADSGSIECEPTHYQQLVRRLIYLTITRPYLSYPVGLLSQVMQAPRNIHLDCDKRVLQYMSGTLDYDILYESTIPIPLEGYTDVGWVSYKAYRCARLQGSSSLSEVESSVGVARSSQTYHCRVCMWNRMT